MRTQRATIPPIRIVAHDPIPVGYLAAVAAWMMGQGPRPEPHPLTGVRPITQAEADAMQRGGQ